MTPIAKFHELLDDIEYDTPIEDDIAAAMIIAALEKIGALRTLTDRENRLREVAVAVIMGADQCPGATP